MAKNKLEFDHTEEKIFVTDVKHLKYNPGTFNMRWKMPTDDDIARMASAIKEDGQENPVVCMKLNNDIHVIQGFCRTRSIQLINAEEIENGVGEVDRTPIKFRMAKDKAEIKSIFLSNISENEVRFQLTPMDKAYGMAKLYNDFKMTQEEIGGRFNVSQGTVSNYMRLLELSDDVKDDIHTGNMLLSDALKLLKVPEEKRDEVLVRAKLDSLPNEDKGKSDRVSTPRLPKGAIENAATEVTGGKVKFKKSISDLIEWVNKEESKEDPEIPEGGFRIVNLLIRWFQEGLPNDKLKYILIKYSDTV